MGRGERGARAVAVRVHVLEVGHEPRPGEADRDDEWAEQEQELTVPQQQLLVLCLAYGSLLIQGPPT